MRRHVRERRVRLLSLRARAVCFSVAAVYARERQSFFCCFQLIAQVDWRVFFAKISNESFHAISSAFYKRIESLADFVAILKIVERGGSQLRL